MNHFSWRVRVPRVISYCSSDQSPWCCSRVALHSSGTPQLRAQRLTPDNKSFQVLVTNLTFKSPTISASSPWITTKLLDKGNEGSCWAAWVLLHTSGSCIWYNALSLKMSWSISRGFFSKQPNLSKYRFYAHTMSAGLFNSTAIPPFFERTLHYSTVCVCKDYSVLMNTNL